MQLDLLLHWHKYVDSPMVRFGCSGCQEGKATIEYNGDVDSFIQRNNPTTSYIVQKSFNSNHLPL